MHNESSAAADMDLVLERLPNGQCAWLRPDDDGEPTLYRHRPGPARDRRVRRFRTCPHGRRRLRMSESETTGRSPDTLVSEQELAAWMRLYPPASNTAARLERELSDPLMLRRSADI